MRLYHNLASLNLFAESKKIEAKQSTSLSRITSGYKINAAKDNPNDLAKSEKFRMQIRGLQMAQKNAQDGISMLQTGEGGMDNITGMVQRIRQLVVQAGDGANSQGDITNINNEINQLTQGIDEIAHNTTFNDVNLLDTNSSGMKAQIGANEKESITIPTYDLTSSGLNLNSLDITNPKGISDALNTIDSSITTILKARSTYGAIENRFETSINDLGDISDRLDASDSSIRDADIAEEMSEYTKDNILSQAGNAMMVQSNKLPQDILNVLSEVKAR
ncbi:MAG: flagellin [Bacillota bacterium]|nr:flagellin [Bacillota bacterium]